MDADAVLKQIEKQAKDSFLPIIGPTKGKYLVETIKRFQVNKILEVGTLVGYSAILMATRLGENGKVVTIEINKESARKAHENINKAGLTDKIDIHIGDAVRLIPELTGRFDMVFLDAGKDEYFDYLKLAEGKLKKGGVVFADNVKIFADRMHNFLDYVRKSPNYSSEYIDVGFDGVEISRKLF